MAAIDLLTVSKEIIGLGTTLAKAQHARRLALAEYLGKIADCIQQISDEARKINPPDYSAFLFDHTGARRTLCAELEVYGRDCGRILTEMLDPDTAAELAERIKDATYTRRGMAPGFLLSADPASSLSSDLRQLEEAVGHLRGTANTLRAPVVVFDRIARPRSVKSWWKRIWAHVHKSWILASIRNKRYTQRLKILHIMLREKRRRRRRLP